jgi:branched-chain amino acid transport system substrate-binding protein
VGLTPDPAYYRAGDHQLHASLYVGTAQAKGSQPEDLFHVEKVVSGDDAAESVADTGCKLTWPS